MMFRRVAIVGVGLIGGSLGMAMRQRQMAQTVVGVGRRVETLEAAQRLGAIDEGTTDFFHGVHDADLIVLATPIQQVLADLARLAGQLPPNAIVTDVGSVKSVIVKAGEKYIPRNFVGSHPMAGSEKSGVEAARSDLFDGATWVVTPTERTPPDKATAIAELARAVGSRVLQYSPHEHDQAVALTSHLPHVLAYALAAQAKESETHTPGSTHLAAGSWASMTRVAHSSPHLWQEIALANRPALLAALETYQEELQRAHAALEAGDGAGLLAAFQRGHLTESADQG